MRANQKLTVAEQSHRCGRLRFKLVEGSPRRPEGGLHPDAIAWTLPIRLHGPHATRLDSFAETGGIQHHFFVLWRFVFVGDLSTF